MCRIITALEAKGITPGIFKLIFTRNGYVRKLAENELITGINNDDISYSLLASNEEDIIVFTNIGKVSRLSVSKIPLYAKGSVGTDIRTLNKYITSPIICAVRESILIQFTEKKFSNFIYIISKLGYIKRIDMTDIINTPISGFVYSKLDPNDEVQTILFGPDKLEVGVYVDNRLIRIPGTGIPCLKRSTKGNKVQTNGSIISGMNFLLPNATDLVIVTKQGMVNRLPIQITMPNTNKDKRYGVKVIKLGQNDNIISVWTCRSGQKLVVNDTRSIKSIPIESIQFGTSLSMGIQMFSNPTRVTLED